MALGVDQVGFREVVTSPNAADRHVSAEELGLLVCRGRVEAGADLSVVAASMQPRVQSEDANSRTSEIASKVRTARGIVAFATSATAKRRAARTGEHSIAATRDVGPDTHISNTPTGARRAIYFCRFSRNFMLAPNSTTQIHSIDNDVSADIDFG